MNTDTSARVEAAAKAAYESDGLSFPYRPLPWGEVTEVTKDEYRVIAALKGDDA